MSTQNWSKEIAEAMQKYGYETENRIEAAFGVGWGMIKEHFPEGVTNEYGMTYSYLYGPSKNPQDFIDMYFRVHTRK